MRKCQRVEPKLSCTLPLCFSAVPAQLDLSLGESKSVFFLPFLLTGMYNVPIITDIRCAIFFNPQNNLSEENEPQRSQ